MERADASKNLRLWNKVKQTDPDFTKDYKGKGGFEGSAINAMYLIEKATSIWGPLGSKWGYAIEEERYDQGTPCGLFPNSDVVIYNVVHTIRLKFWYTTDEGEKASFSHYGHTDFISSNKFGPVCDSEAPKKSLTDALKKCLSMVGFSADVFMGLFDDQVYVEEAANRAALEKADDKIEEEARQASDYRTWLEDAIKLLSSAVTLHELGILYKTFNRKLALRNDERMIKHFKTIYDQRKSELEAKS